MRRNLSSLKRVSATAALVAAVAIMAVLAVLPAQAGEPITIMNGSLPTGRERTSAVWDGTNAYIFGGFDDDFTRLNQVVRYNPANDLVSISDGKLPESADKTSAVWDGSNAYVFGGRSVRGPWTRFSAMTLGRTRSKSWRRPYHPSARKPVRYGMAPTLTSSGVAMGRGSLMRLYDTPPARRVAPLPSWRRGFPHRATLTAPYWLEQTSTFSAGWIPLDL